MSRNEAFAPWQCPLCGGALQGENDLKCEKGHCFDRAREGYWHLLPVQSMRTKAPGDSKEMVAATALGVLQAARLRMSKTEFISCPSCGRTLFDLQSTLKEVKKATGHLKGLKIGVMGCIVNGPGEMADADYGYVGAGPGRVSLYRNKELVVKNIPAETALTELISIIKSDGNWTDPS